MRLMLLAILTILAASGCTATRLERSLVDQADTLTDLQYKQVLANIAMLSPDFWSLPSQVTLRDGSSQVQDLGSASSLFDVRIGTTAHPYVSGSRTVVDQWGVRPVVNDIELKVLRMAYQRASGLDVRLQYDPDLANDLAHELKKQLTQPDNLDFVLDNFYVTSALGGPPGRDGNAILSISIDKDSNSVTPVGQQSVQQELKKAPYANYVRYQTLIDQAKVALDVVQNGLNEQPQFISKILKNENFGYRTEGEGDVNFKRKVIDQIKGNVNPPLKDPIEISGADESHTKAAKALILRLRDDPGGLSPTDELLLKAAGGALRALQDSLNGEILKAKSQVSEATQHLDMITSKDVDLKLGQAKTASNSFNAQVLSSSEEELIRPGEFMVPLSLLEPGRVHSEPELRVTPTVKEVRRQVKKLEDDLSKIPAGWYCVGKKPPRDAAAVGRHGDVYAWVERRNIRQLAEFTLTLLNITDLIKESSVVTEPGGPKYSPTPAVGPAGRN